MTTTINLEFLRRWIGKVEESTDLVTPRAVLALRAVLAFKAANPCAQPASCDSGEAAPLTMHWCYLLALTSGPGADPGARLDDRFVPPVPLAQRMWAGGQTTFVEPLRVGDIVTRRSEIVGVDAREGRSGPLCFVTVEHTYSTARGVATVDIQNLVFRDPTPQAAEIPAALPARDQEPRGARYSTTLHLDPVTLFRYSALTHNGARSHYDRPFSTDVEGLPALMVHGPLQAALLLEFARELRGGSALPASFTHRGVNPLFEGAFTLNADPTPAGLELWTVDGSGRRCMTAEVSW
jgi:3-methylfumaryl-CoA hydratase